MMKLALEQIELSNQSSESVMPCEAGERSDSIFEVIEVGQGGKQACQPNSSVGCDRFEFVRQEIRARNSPRTS